MKFKIEDQTFEIDDKYVIYSPFLCTISETSVGIDVENDAILLDVDPQCFKQYILFLQGDDFEFNDEVCELFDFMGHENKMGFNIDFWKVKLQDNWIRDNFYKYELYNDPYYGLTEIPIVNPLKIPLEPLHKKKVVNPLRSKSTFMSAVSSLHPMPLISNFNSFKISKDTPDIGDDFRPEFSLDNKIVKKQIECKGYLYAAGGACLYMAGMSEKFSDVDLFPTGKQIAIDYINNLKGDVTYRHNHVAFWGSSAGIEHIAVLRTKNTIETTGWYDRILGSKKFQIILRLYKSPSEIVHGFDVDCVGILYDGEKLWATKRALYAMEHKINHFDPCRSSPSYAYRLSKYQARGFSMYLPHLDTSLVNGDKVQEMLRKIEDIYFQMDLYDEDHYHENIEGNVISDPYETLMRAAEFFKEKKDISIGEFSEYIDKIDNIRKVSNKYGSMIRWIIGKESGSNMREIIPCDPVSILILSSIYGIHTSLWSQSDYNPNWKNDLRNKRDNNISISDIITNLVWKEQNPMEQVTSTFYPTPIDGEESSMYDWYSTSPLLSNEDMPWILKNEEWVSDTLTIYGDIHSSWISDISVPEYSKDIFGSFGDIDSIIDFDDTL